MTIYDYLKELEAIPLYDTALIATQKGGEAALRAIAVRRCIKILEENDNKNKRLGLAKP